MPRRILLAGLAVVLIAVAGVFPGSRASAQEKKAAPQASTGEEREKPDTARRRLEWFYQQRAFPLDHIPSGARQQALEHVQRMLEAEGKIVPQLQPGAAAAAPQTIVPSTTSWTPIGPQPAIHPNPLFGNVSGRVTALAVDPTNPNIVYLGGAQGGVWKSTDAGLNWVPLTDNQPSLAIGSIAIDPSPASCNPAPCRNIYVGTGEQNFSIDSYYGAGILRSTDGGNSWTQLGASTFVGPFSSGFSPGGGARIGCLVVNPAIPSVLLACVQIFVVTSGGSSSGIYRSTDGGATWTQVLSGAAGTEVLFHPTNASIAYAALGTTRGDADNGVYKSTDGGVTWARADANGTQKLPTTNVGRIEIAIDPNNPQILYASIQNSPPPGSTASTFGSLLGFFKSMDGGVNWAQLSNTPDYCSAQCWYDNVIRVVPASPSIVFAGGSAQFTTGPNPAPNWLMRSTDGGSTWQPVPSGGGVLLHVDQHAMAFAPLSGGKFRLYVGNDGGAYRTDDAAANPISWVNLNSTLNITQFYPGASIHPSDDQIGFGGTQDNGTQNFIGSLPWNIVTCGDGGWTAIDFQVPSTVYAACEDIDVRKSLQNGANNTFFEADFGIDPTDRSAFIPPLVMDPSNPQRLYFGTFRVWQTNDGTTTWTPISGDLTDGSGNVSTVAVAATDPKTVYVGTSPGVGTGATSRVHVSVNAAAGSATFTDITAGLPTRSVTQIAVGPSSAQTAYVTFSGFGTCSGCDGRGHVFKTISGGTTWTDISGNLPDSPVNDIVVDPDDSTSQTIYVATDVGVFQTTNGGAAWSTLVTGLPKVAVLSLKLREPSRTLRAATHGRGMWDLQLINFTPTFNLSSIRPSSDNAGDPNPLTVTVNGNGFIQGVPPGQPPESVVRWNGTPLQTAFVTANQLTATVPTNLLANSGTAQVTVNQSGGSGPISNALVFTVLNSAPTLTSINPMSASQGSPGFTLTVTGSNFQQSSVARWNISNGSSANRSTTPVNATTLTAAIPASDLTDAGVFSVTVFTPPPGGGETNPTLLAAQFTVNPLNSNPPPNDNFANATNVPNTMFTDNTVNSFNATTEVTDPTPPPALCFPFGTQGLVSNGTAKSVWWKFTANGNGTIQADTVGSLYDTILSVWTGGPGSFTSVACNDDINLGVVRVSRVIFNAIQGTTYFFMVTDFEGHGGKTVFNLNATLTQVPDFSLSANPTSQTVTAGQPATYTITVTAVNGTFSNPVTLACNNLPTLSACTFTPTSSVTPGSSSASSTLTISTAANSAAPAVQSSVPGGLGLPWIGLWVAMFALALTVALGARRSPKLARLAARLPLVLLVFLVLLKLAACGGGSSPPPPKGTPPGTYMVTVTGTSGQFVRSTQVTLIVR